MAVKGEETPMDTVERKTPTKAIEDDSELASAIDDDEPTTEELIEMLRESVQQANSGQTRPVDELLRELDEILAENDDAS